MTIGVDWPERKRWWRNLSDDAPVEIWLAGVRRAGTGRAHGDEHAGVTVEIQLDGEAAAAPRRREAPPERGLSCARGRTLHPAAQNEQWCVEAKFVSTCGCGVASDSTSALGVERRPGHVLPTTGSPSAAKFAHAARMLVGERLLRRVQRGGEGRVRLVEEVLDLRRVRRDRRAGSVRRRAAARCRRRTRRRTSARACDVQRSTCSAGQAKFASETSVLRARTGSRVRAERVLGRDRRRPARRTRRAPRRSRSRRSSAVGAGRRHEHAAAHGQPKPGDEDQLLVVVDAVEDRHAGELPGGQRRPDRLRQDLAVDDARDGGVRERR